MNKEMYERPELTVLNDDGSTINPEPRFILVVAAIFFVLAAALYSVAGAIEIHAAVNAHTAVSTITTTV